MYGFTTDSKQAFTRDAVSWTPAEVGARISQLIQGTQSAYAVLLLISVGEPDTYCMLTLSGMTTKKISGLDKKPEINECIPLTARFSPSKTPCTRCEGWICWRRRETLV